MPAFNYLVSINLEDVPKLPGRIYLCVLNDPLDIDRLLPR
jgi:hypothetical protein